MARRKKKENKKAKKKAYKSHYPLSILAAITIPLLIMLFLLLFVIKTWPVVKMILFSTLIVALLMLAFIVLPFFAKEYPSKKWLFKSLTGLLIIIALGSLFFLLLNVMLISDNTPSLTIGNTTISYSPEEKYIPEIISRDVKKEKENIELNLRFGNLSADDSSDAEKYSYEMWGYPQEDSSLISVAIQPAIRNQGFEDDENNDGFPEGWRYNGKSDYASEGCFAGEKCIHVDVDDSDYGFFQLNSEGLELTPGEIYEFSFYINCIHCEPSSSYLAVFWLKDGYECGGEFVENLEFKRDILNLHKTSGYEKFSLYAKAPEGAEAAIVGFRTHMEGTLIYPKTEFYIDAS